MQAKITEYVNMTKEIEKEESFRETEVGLIPEDWEVVRLGDAASYLKAGGTPRRSIKKYWGGSIPFVRIGDITAVNKYIYTTKGMITEEGLKNSSAWLVPENSVLLSMYASIGEAAITKIPLATNQAILAIIPKENVDVEFLFYCLKYHGKRLYSFIVQTTQKNVNRAITENLKIPRPPLPEQQKIAKVLGTIQTAVKQQNKIIEAAKNLKKSLMQKLFTKGLGHTEFKETEIGPMPIDWKKMKLGDDDILTSTQYGLSLRGRTEGKYPILRMNNLVNGYVDINDLQFVDVDDEVFRKFKLVKGDILFNRTNSIELVGKTSIFTLEGNFVFASYLIRLIINPKTINPYFLNFYLNWDATQVRLKSLASRGVSQANISATRLKTLNIPLPPLPEQQEIAHILSTADKKIEVEEKRKTTLNGLFKTMLHKLMTGEIRLRDVEV